MKLCLAMFSVARPSIKKNLFKLEEYMRSCFTRKEAYERLAEELGVTIEAIRNAASKAHLTSSQHSLNCFFSQREEEMLVCACLVYARQGTPFTIPLFAEVARNLAKRDADHPFSRHFVLNFIHRHRTELCLDNGKITSPTRKADEMLQMCKEFIASFTIPIASHKANEKNIFVFDETIIGANFSLPLVIGETKDAAGGNNNVILAREAALGSYIPFSMVDGSTPFRVFIIRTKEFHKSADLEEWVAPAKEKGLRDSPRRVFLSSETGFISNELFSVIMDEFTEWWTTTHSGLECYLISDNLSIHRNEEIVKKAESKGIHMLNIMPGSSHWFQVHDQLPFAILKKELMVQKNKFFGSFVLPREVIRTILVSNFYHAEACALEPKVLIQSFADVGLWPFNPTKIEENCRKFCRVDPDPSKDDDLSRVASAIETSIGEELKKAGQILSEMKVVSVISPKKVKKRKRQSKKTAAAAVARDSDSSTSTEKNTTRTNLKPVRKRGRPPKSSNQK